VWAMPVDLILGVGMGTCFSSIYDVALGTSHRSKPLAARRRAARVQQLASGHRLRRCDDRVLRPASESWSGHAMTVSVAVVGGIALLCLGLVWLLPRRAAEQAFPRNEWKDLRCGARAIATLILCLRIP